MECNDWRERDKPWTEEAFANFFLIFTHPSMSSSALIDHRIERPASALVILPNEVQRVNNYGQDSQDPELPSYQDLVLADKQLKTQKSFNYRLAKFILRTDSFVSFILLGYTVLNMFQGNSSFFSTLVPLIFFIFANIGITGLQQVSHSKSLNSA